MQKITVIGLGRMGTPICANLVAAGHVVVAHDVAAERESAALECGAAWSATAAAAVADADILITVLPGPGALGTLMQESLLAAMPPGATWIDMTSNAPQTAGELRTLAAKYGVATLEAPIGGSPEDAAVGRLRLYAGGDAACLARLRPVLEALAQPGDIVHMGGHGAGYTAKLLVNALWFGQALATAEVLLLGSRAGIDLSLLRDVLSAGPASSEFIRRDLSSLFAGDYLTSFELDHICEQLSTVAGLARDLAVPHTVAESVRAVHRQALERYGPVGGELLGVALLEEEAGVELRG